MPVVHLIVNSEAPREAQEELLGTLTSIFAEHLKVPKHHMHVLISDGRLFSFGGNAQDPAVYITVKAAASQIPPILRQGLVMGMMPALKATYTGLVDARVTTFFEEVPVEQIVVGTSVMLFRHRGDESGTNSPRVSQDQARPGFGRPSQDQHRPSNLQP